MKLLYMWIEQFRNIVKQGVIIDDEYLITVQHSENNAFSCSIEYKKNDSYEISSPSLSINNVAGLIGKNATGKTSIIECLCSQPYVNPEKDNRHYFLVFLNSTENCIEIRAQGMQISGNDVVQQSYSKYYNRYIIPLSGYASVYSQAEDITHIFCLAPQKCPDQYKGYTVLDIPTIVGDLAAFKESNSFKGGFDFFCDFPELGGSDNRLVVFLKDEDQSHTYDYFKKDEYTSEEYKCFFIYKLSQILFSNLRTYLYHQKPEFTISGKRIRLPDEDKLQQEDKQCMELLTFSNFLYPQEESIAFTYIKDNCLPKSEIKEALDFFSQSTFSFLGKNCYDEYISKMYSLFEQLFGADSELFTAFYKLEIPFENRYIPIVSAIQQCLDLDNLNGNWTNGIFVNFEWLSTGEIQLAMLFSAIYQRMSEEYGDFSKRDVIWAIDEPEMHMHPELGRNFVDVLNEAVQQFKSRGLLNSCQFIFATHSPFIVQNLGKYKSLFTLVSKENNQICTYPFNDIAELKLPNRSEFSFNLIMYKIFGVPTVELHNELYGVLQEVTQCENEKQIERWFTSKSVLKSKQWVRIKKGCPEPPNDVTLETFIRNSIHHPENQYNTMYTPVELQDSTDEMIKLLKDLGFLQ